MAEDSIDAQLEAWVGRSLGPTAEAPEPVNEAMIHHWVDALDDRNPVYDDAGAAARSRFAGLVAPPAMLQTWTMPRPTLAGIAERGGSPVETLHETPLRLLDRAGFVATLATDSELEFARYLRPGERLRSSAVVESISERKATALGQGHFVTWVIAYETAAGEAVGSQRFRVLKFQPGSPPAEAGRGARRERGAGAPEGEKLPDFELPLTSTLIVAGAIASRDFMPVHHDRDYARGQGAPDLFMNILTTNGYVSRYVTDWAGPEARLQRIAIRLGAPAIPGQTLRFSGEVARSGPRAEGSAGGRELEVAVRLVNELGPHATGTVLLDLPD